MDIQGKQALEGHRQYKSNSEDCVVCPFRSQCFSQKQKSRVITRHIWEDYKDQARANKRTSVGKKLYKVCCSIIEQVFADAKELHSYQYARFRGQKSVQIQAFLTAICQNKLQRLIAIVLNFAPEPEKA